MHDGPRNRQQVDLVIGHSSDSSSVDGIKRSAVPGVLHNVSHSPPPSSPTAAGVRLLSLRVFVCGSEQYETT